jgi:hypothetical protein
MLELYWKSKINQPFRRPLGRLNGGLWGGGCPPRNQVKFRLLAAPGQYRWADWTGAKVEWGCRENRRGYSIPCQMVSRRKVPFRRVPFLYLCILHNLPTNSQPPIPNTPPSHPKRPSPALGVRRLACSEKWVGMFDNARL